MATNLMLTDPTVFAQAQRIARAFSESELVPKDMRGKLSNCLVALMLAHEMGESPLMVCQNIYFVGGRAGWMSNYLIARANKSGVFMGPLRWKTEGSGEGLAVTCYARLRDAPDDDNLVEVKVSLAMAKADGWTRNEKYKSIPEQMLRWRSASWLIRLYAPDVMFGLPTADELEDTMKDITPPPAPRMDDFRPGASLRPRIVVDGTTVDAAGTVDELMNPNPPDDLADAAGEADPPPINPTSPAAHPKAVVGKMLRDSVAATEIPPLIAALVEGIEATRTLVDANAFIKRNGPAIQGLDDADHQRFHDAQTAHMRALEEGE
jgi:hypothetical protein